MAVNPSEAVASGLLVNAGGTVEEGEVEDDGAVTAVGGCVEIIVITVVGKDCSVPDVTVTGIVDIEVRSIAVI